MKTDEQIGKECMEEIRRIATSTMLAELECRAALKETAKELAAEYLERRIAKGER